MKFSSWLRVGALAAVLLVAACKNSGGAIFSPPTPGTPPPGPTLPPDAGGGTGISDSLDGTLIDCVTPFYDGITPFRNPLELPQLVPDSSGLGDFPGLSAMALAKFGEVGNVLLVLYNDGILIYDSIGRPLARPLTFDVNCNLTSAAFLWPPAVTDDLVPLDIVRDLGRSRTPDFVPDSETFLVSSIRGGIGIWEFERGYVGAGEWTGAGFDDYFFDCDLSRDENEQLVGPRDWWINGSLSNASYCADADRMCAATNATLQLFNLPGGPGNLGLEYDAFGNLWHRSVALENFPDHGLATCDTLGGFPILVLWERGLTRISMGDEIVCPYEIDEIPGFGYQPGQCGMHVFTSPNVRGEGSLESWGIDVNFNLGTVSDFDFTSDNRMVFADGEAHSIGWTYPIGDHFDFHPFGQVSGTYNPPAPPQVQFWRGDFGGNTGPINTHFNTPWGVSVDRLTTPNEVYITDFGNARLTVFNDQGIFLRSIGPSISPQVNLTGPMDVYFDDFCRVFVLDRTLRPDFSVSGEVKILFRENCPVPSPGSAKITVRDGRTGAPLEAARVVLGLFAGEIVGITNSQGKVDFPTIPPGQRFVTVNAGGFLSKTLEFFVGSGETILIEDAPASGSVNLFPIGDAQLGGVTGKVRDTSSGQVIGGAVVLVRGTGQLDITLLTGLFSITGIVAGTHTLDVSANGYFPASKGVSVVAGLSVDVGDILLTPIPPT
ncbi:carboxypeptidase regulatory-like domain-containing protein [bacterium]|nr:carboxypeptidase regulatory-like domain-containing protein [bacterium]